MSSSGDHSVIIFEYKVVPLYVKDSKVMYMYNKTNEADVRKVVEKWKSVFSLNKSIENLWNNFIQMYENILLCVPRKKVTMRKGFAYLNNPIFRVAVKKKGVYG